jgi:DNA-binding LacI/PurR family transcriptional regulator
VINTPDDSFARKEVRERVWAAIRETGYVPNQTARELKLRQAAAGADASTGQIACVLGRAAHLEENPFFAQLARAIEQQALQMGYSVTHSFSIYDGVDGDGMSQQLGNGAQPTQSGVRPDGNLAQLATHLKRLPAGPLDGIILLGKVTDEVVRLIEKHCKNVLYVGRNVLGCGWDQVICDGYEATRIAMEYLVSCGHRRIGYLGETKNEVRYQAYLDVMGKICGDRPSMETSWVVSCRHDGESGYRAAGRLLEGADPSPTAVFCAADAVAIAAMRRFGEAGVRVPGRISVIGMDNIELSAYVSPMLTTVGMPTVEMGNMAVKTLLDRITKQHRLPMKIFLPNRLLVRESVGKI